MDNSAGPGLAAEHGLSFWIEAGGKRILFDTGQGGALAANARALGVDLADTDWLVLSHGHYDHTGGISHVANASRRFEVFCHPGVMSPRYSIRGGQARPIQIPRESEECIRALPPQRVHWVTEPRLLSEDIGITGPIPREASFEDTGGPFYLDAEGTLADRIEDDLSLWIRTEGGVAVCTGCCHAGLVNTLNAIQRLSGGRRIRAIVGGFHLLSAGAERLERTVSALRSVDPDLVVPCHCTGEHATGVLRDALGERVSAGASGMRLRF